MADPKLPATPTGGASLPVTPQQAKTLQDLADAAGDLADSTRPREVEKLARFTAEFAASRHAQQLEKMARAAEMLSRAADSPAFKGGGWVKDLVTSVVSAQAAVKAFGGVSGQYVRAIESQGQMLRRTSQDQAKAAQARGAAPARQERPQAAASLALVRDRDRRRQELGDPNRKAMLDRARTLSEQGTVNDATFLGKYPAESLLFNGADVTPGTDSRGEDTFTIDLRLNSNPKYHRDNAGLPEGTPLGTVARGHNWFLRRIANGPASFVGYRKLTANGQADGTAPFRTSDFRNLFRLDQNH